jgi:ribonuclease HII
MRAIKKPEAGLICGFDEAGRGPLAGPVCAAAVILPPDFPVETLGDSKKLSPAKREAVRPLILKRALAWGVGWASAPEIDRINILRASLLAMERAWEDLALRFPRFSVSGAPPSPRLEPVTVLEPTVLGPLMAVVDGLYTPALPIPAEALVKADASVPAVMAASILAKTQRDRLMELYGALYPEYGYEVHKGYPTRAHREAVLRHGPSPIQRLSFTVKVNLSSGIRGKCVYSLELNTGVRDIIVLDEPTAAIDPYEETRIYRRFAEISKGKTAIIVTHRLGSVRPADRIVVRIRSITEVIERHY